MKKIVLVTGVSRNMGLGFETARQLSALGYTVVITARDIDKVTLLAADAGLIAKTLDVTSESSIDKLVSQFSEQFGKLDVLINNAGGFFDQGGAAASTDMTFVKDAFDLNVLGAWRTIKAFKSLLEKSESGRIVNVSSGAGSFTDPVFGMANHAGNVPAYAITKLALNGLTVKFAKELKETKIKINSVCPGFVATYPGTEAWGARPVTEGVKGIVWAATLPDDGPSGGFFRDGKSLNW
ncbi:MAG TPA: SDR family NAD(P)-dependent oxidoreductase [Cyclobacteriaceae bacterium]|nr:SDR family NAD(P)-dependent oxidoreductase [Cyclobacteriaceae bacterium]HMV08489.1 SDR family NAD(P)-dependent oxidoreductase [Cyclobacteriaceae bacterium]HMV89200.1 SDR family NAD(P)-dependent oxidoreductase [Cyclobacteriaceae bacterium]HMX01262.1 SDR family NAD(P)-dependent oxidoreductase [Cyclobacteriaceae bacterium]HMX51324.1 SDR family NAD(P)-dependent oxidoreductase [Cyclobacteriaceae bacterium]